MEKEPELRPITPRSDTGVPSGILATVPNAYLPHFAYSYIMTFKMVNKKKNKNYLGQRVKEQQMKVLVT